MAADLKTVLDKLREEARNTTEQGRGFEHLVKFWLENDPVYKDRFTKVELITKWRKSRGEPGGDKGVDLVAEEPDGDRINYWAIQAKFFAPDTTISRKDINTFLAESGKKPFTRRMVVTTTEKWGSNAIDVLHEQKIPCVRAGFAEMRDSGAPWDDFLNDRKPKAGKPRDPLPHQEKAINDVVAGLEHADRGQLIMACGTGKTYTSLRIAERISRAGGNVLFLVPSLALLSQALREWSRDHEIPQRNFVVCSDIKVGFEEDVMARDLAWPATTDARELANKLKAPFEPGTERMNIVFSTYHSIDVVSKAQKKFGAPEFDLAVCDEAHRTTGVETGDKDEEGYYTAIHNGEYIRAKKRLYMTATPRLYVESAKQKAKEHDAVLYSMDDREKFGGELHRLGFAESVRRGLLADYKVLVLTIDETNMAKAVQQSMADSDGTLKLRDAAKLVGCWNGLAKRFTPKDDSPHLNRDPMRRAVAFTRRIVDSQLIMRSFNDIVKEYKSKGGGKGRELLCEVQHVDGTMDARVRADHLDWLRDKPDKNTCRILSNARCLSEGVDVPALDAVMFLEPRKSQIDVVQAVGRVMRKAKGKDLGYVILPVVIPAGEPPEKTLSSDHQSYKVVWDVLQALRSHDERFSAMINSIDLNKAEPGKIEVVGVGAPEDEKTEAKPGEPQPDAPTLPFPEFENWRDTIFARIVKKCGDIHFWGDWAKDVAEIAQTNITLINKLLETNRDGCREKFNKFLSQLRQNLNPAVTKDDAVEMLAQHLITRPVFDALFEDYHFVKQNPVSLAMQGMLDILDKAGLQAETEKLQKFYDSVNARASVIKDAEGKQTLMKELYDKFFATAFKEDSQRLGIVYTPVEVVDFILASADAALRKEFNKGLANKDVHILDPFTGTGTFMARLLQSQELIPKNALRRKYESELHANELVLLAYYIAAVNIEESFHARAGGAYSPFEGIVLADTFMINERSKIIDKMFTADLARARKQKAQEIRVIVGNPPYSVAQRVDYPALDKRITNTYAALSTATNRNSLYDSYIRAIRWASDRIGDEGIVAFVTNGGFIDGNAAAGLRKSLIKEFSSVYCLNMRGNANTSGERRRKEGGNIFRHGAKTPVAVTLLIKKRNTNSAPAKLYYHDIGDYLTTDDKLGRLTSKKHADFKWQTITPDDAGDWINQRRPEFQKFLPMGIKENKGKTHASPSVFCWYSRGVATAKDAWVYNFSRRAVAKNMRAMIAFYNSQVADYKAAKKRNPKLTPDDFVDNDLTRIKWDRELKQDLAKGKVGVFADKNIRQSAYRPFCEQWLYFDRQFDNMVYRMPSIFPEAKTENRVICVSGIGAGNFSALMTKTLPDLGFASAGQCFPLYYYNSADGQLVGDKQKRRGKTASAKMVRRDNISDKTLEMFRKQYKDKKISKEDIFYYVYGVLHSPEYKTRYANDLRKVLARIPFVTDASDFRAYAKAGRKLADLHVNYETAPEYRLSEKGADLVSKKDYAVRKMRFAPAGAAGNRRELDKSAVIVNDSLTLEGIPKEAHDYIVNGKSAVEWVLDCYQKSVHTDSGIANDPNQWSDDPKYIVSLLKRVVRISVESAKIIKSLPPLKIKK